MTTKRPSFIFLLGRPGCGKSAIYRMLRQRLREEGLANEVMRIDDFPVLKEINHKLHELERPRRTIFVEFARDKYARA